MRAYEMTPCLSVCLSASVIQSMIVIAWTPNCMASDAGLVTSDHAYDARCVGNESATYNNHACLRFTYIFVARIHGRLSCHAPVGRLRLTVDRFLALGIYRYPEMICYDTPAAWAHNDDMLWLCVSPFHLSQSINSPLWRH